MKYNPITGLNLSSSLTIDESSVQKIFFLHNCVKDISVYVCSVDEHDDVGKKEIEKSGVIPQADALVEPRAVVVELGDAVITDCTML